MRGYATALLCNARPVASGLALIRSKEEHGTTAIVTTTASEETQQIHDRMPVILEKPDFARWLASEPLATQEAHRLLAPPPAGSLIAWEVSTRVNNVRNDDAGLINEISPGSR